MNVRTLVVLCPDWPVIATAASADEAVAVIAANRVTATSPAARAEGVEVGLRRRDAQRRCPVLHIVDPDPDRDARVFASIAALVDQFTPPKYREGPRVGKASDPGEDSSTRGVN